MDTTPAHELYVKLFQNSVEVPGPETEMISAACKEAKVWAIVGVNERRPNSTGTTWNTQIMFNRRGEIVNKHQKFVPTVAERLIHANGTTGSAVSAPTEFGTLSGLICGEHANALAMYSTSLEYPVVHLASWPTHFSPHLIMQDAIQNSTRGFAYSLKCFLINSVGVIGDDAIEAYGVNEEVRKYLLAEQNKPGATIIAPSGNVIAGPLEGGDGILYATVDPSECILAKYGIDIAGHYNRPEIFAHCFARFFEGK